MSNFIIGVIFGIILVVGYSLWFLCRKLSFHKSFDYTCIDSFSTVDEKIHKSFVMIHNIEPHSFDMSSRIHEDMGISRVSLGIILADLENQCDVKIDDSDIAKLITLDDISQLLLKKEWGKSRPMLCDSRFIRSRSSSDHNVNLPHISVALICESNESNNKLLGSLQQDIILTTNENCFCRKKIPNLNYDDSGTLASLVTKRNRYTILPAFQRDNCSNEMIGSIMSSQAMIIVIDVDLGLNSRLISEALLFSKQTNIVFIIIYLDNVNQFDPKERQERTVYYQNNVRQLLLKYGFTEDMFFIHKTHTTITQDINGALKLIDTMDSKFNSIIYDPSVCRFLPARFYVHFFSFSQNKIVINGIVTKGILKKKDKIKFISSDGSICESRIDAISMALYDIQCAYAGDYVSLTLSDVGQQYIRSGAVAYGGGDEFNLCASFKSVITIRKRKYSDYKLAMISGKPYSIYIGLDRVAGTVFFNNSSLIEEGRNLECKIELDTPIKINTDCTSVLIRDNNKTIATGRIFYE